MGGVDYTAQIVVREARDRRRFYDLTIIEPADPSSGSSLTGSTGGTAPDATGSGESITETRDEVQQDPGESVDIDEGPAAPSSGPLPHKAAGAGRSETTSPEKILPDDAFNRHFRVDEEADIEEEPGGAPSPIRAPLHLPTRSWIPSSPRPSPKRPRRAPNRSARG